MIQGKAGYKDWKKAFRSWYPKTQKFVAGAANLTSASIAAVCYIKAHLTNLDNGATATVSLKYNEVMDFARSEKLVDDNGKTKKRLKPLSKEAVLEAYLRHIDRSPGADISDWK